MEPLAIGAVLVAALTHASWNLAAKKAAQSRHFVFLYSVASTLLYSPIVIWILMTERPAFEPMHWATSR